MLTDPKPKPNTLTGHIFVLDDSQACLLQLIRQGLSCLTASSHVPIFHNHKPPARPQNPLDLRQAQRTVGPVIDRVKRKHEIRTVVVDG